MSQERYSESRHWFAGLAALLMVSVAPGCAGMMGSRAPAKKRVAVLDLKGVSDSRVEVAIRTIVASEHSLIEPAHYKQKARELRARRMRPTHIAKVAAALDLDAVVDARVLRRGKRRLAVRMIVRRGDNGKVMNRYTVIVPRRKSLPQRRVDDLAAGLLAMIDGITGKEDWRNQYHARKMGRNNKTQAASLPPPLKERLHHRRNHIADYRAKQRRQAEDQRAAEAQQRLQDQRRAEKKKKQGSPSPSRAVANRRKSLVAAKETPRTSAKPAETTESSVPVRYDNRGQAIDDEVPDILR